MIRARGICKRYHTLPVLKDMTLDVHRGECVVLCGPSGSGKSTFLRCLNGLEEWDAGTIAIDGVDIGATARNRGRIGRLVGMVFQEFNLFPHMTALENIALGPRVLLRLPRAEARDRARHYLAQVGLAAFADRLPQTLSGGQQQRVAIARALAMQPRVTLFDEPTSALDPEMVKEVLDVMTELAASGMTMVCVTHEMGFASRVASRVAFMVEGCLCEMAPPAEFFGSPRSADAQRFLRHVDPVLA